MSDPRQVDASPAKSFFISMLVKDIELIPAIIDLVDNSVDGARLTAARYGVDYGTFWVHLDVSADKFTIRDNCGGIEAEKARTYAFRFGRPADYRVGGRTVGQFGVGMKRALFKLGDWFRVESATESTRFVLEVDVADWALKQQGHWSFEFKELDENFSGGPVTWGTTVTVRELHDSVSSDFQRAEVLGRLREEIALRHKEAISQGVDVKLNGEALTVREPVLLASELVHPINKTLNIDANGSAVEMRLLAGIAPTQRDEVGLDDEGQAQKFKQPAEAGWYLFCNGRLVFAADKSALTGWGSAAAAYHPQYRHFRGYVYLESDDSSLLPWNTTKTGVDQDNPTFRTVQREIFSALRAVQSVINRRKEEVSALTSAKSPLDQALRAAAPRKLDDLPVSAQYTVPARPPRKPTAPSRVNVQYQVDRDEMDAVMDSLEVGSAREAGLRTFYFYYESEVE